MPNLIFTDFVPLVEADQVGQTGQALVKVIEPGWGSSGYYPAEVLQRDAAAAFPAGTHMYWNHPTLSEKLERPERDLDYLAAVTTEAPRFMANGPKGPGAYAKAKVFGTYAPVVAEIGEHIGVSIQAEGIVAQGEAEGKQGLIVQSIIPNPTKNSIDFVTRPGAGGQVINLFESAGPKPDKRNSLQKLLGRLKTGSDSHGLSEAEAAQLSEARNVGDWLEARFHMRLTGLADDLFGDGYLTREERVTLLAAAVEAMESWRAIVVAQQPQLFTRRPFREVPAQSDPAQLEVAESLNNPTEDQPMDKGTNTGDAKLDALTLQLTEAQTTIKNMALQLNQQNARGHITSKLGEATPALPQLTIDRLTVGLVAAVPFTESASVDFPALDSLIAAAVTRAQAEIKQISEAGGGQPAGNGQVKGLGSGQLGDAAPGGDDASQLFEAAVKRQAAAFADLGLTEDQIKVATGR